MTVRVYRSTDASAPVMSKAIGALTTLLDACLVNGYGSKTAAGWSIAFTTTNIRVYLQGTGSTARYLRVDDSTQANYAADVAGSTGASGVSTLTGRFPITGTTLVWQKSAINKWVLIANEKAFYLFLGSDPAWNTSATYYGPNWYLSYYFGDIQVPNTADTGRCLLSAQIGDIQATTSTANVPGHCDVRAAITSADGLNSRAFFATDETLKSGFVPQARFEASYFISTAPGNGFQTVHPFWGVDMKRIEVQSAIAFGTALLLSRGVMPGLYLPRQAFQWDAAANQTWSGTGTDSGKTFEFFPTIGTNGNWGLGANVLPFIVETSDTWSN